MKVPIYTLAVPILAAFAFAQDTPTPQKPADPAAPSMPDKAAKDKSKDMGKDVSKGKPMDMDKDKSAGQASSTGLAEMKTQTYAGTLMDASCGASGPATSAASSPVATPQAATSSADRAAPSADTKSCPVSASTTQFGLKLKDGKTVKFDDVGNLRAQEAFKAHKTWTDSASASKSIRVKASGVLNGDRLTVVSIN